MPDIVGTVVNLKNFLSKKRTNIEIMMGTKRIPLFDLKENRRYIIPDFQREIRWEKEHLIELMRDIVNSQKFLGNIILTITEDENFEVIDGQQRLTVLLMLIHYIRVNYGEPVEVFETCEIENQSFDGLGMLMNHNFEYDSLTDDEKGYIIDSDDFKQRERYIKLWGSISDSGMLNDSRAAKVFMRNLERCSVNIIASTDDGTGSSIEYFLDVNLKGVKLDPEDIFKGYLFSYDSGVGIRALWKELKKLTFTLNEKKDNYPLMILLKHYFYCDLYNHVEYKDIVFSKTDFILTKEIGDEENHIVYHYEGEHIVKVINNKEFMKNCIKQINRFLEIIKDVVESRNATNAFKNLFQSSAKMDNTEIDVIHNFIKVIILDSDEIPKIVVMKYMLTILMNPASSKSDYRKIYGVYFLSSMFMLFDSKRGGDHIFEIVKYNDWYEKAVSRIQYYFSNSELAERRITAQFHYSVKSDDNNDYIRCKTLATLYNFFEIRDGKVCVKKGAFNELYAFVTNNVDFSVEHFIINNSKKAGINIAGNKVEYSFPTRIRKYSNSLFNFIFIPQDLNRAMDNMHIIDKIKYMDSNSTNIKCNYSKMVFNVVKNDFGMYPDILCYSNQDVAKDNLDKYYTEEFTESYSLYAKGIVDKIIEHFKMSI